MRLGGGPRSHGRYAPRMQTPEARDERTTPDPRWWSRWPAAVVAILVVVAASAGIRIHGTLSNRHFDAESSAGFLTTDPAFICYGARRIVDGGGWAPDDFRADPRVEHPETTDMPAMFTVGQEYLIAWAYLAFDGDVPLHVCAVWVMSLLAALCGLGIGLLTGELCGRPVFGILGALVWATLPASYRTLGFVVVREDLSLPLWALHLWFAARAARTDGWRDHVGAGLLAGAAAATWHAMGSFLLMELVIVVAWFVRTGRSPLGSPQSALGPATTTVVALLVPVLRAKGFFVAPPVLIAWALVLAGWLQRRRDRRDDADPASSARWIPLGLFALSLVALWGAGYGITTALGTHGDYSHVSELLRAKLVHLGRLPTDPSELSFDTRLMWQGPFSTAEPITFAIELGLVLLCVPLGLCAVAATWWRGRAVAPDRSGGPATPAPEAATLAIGVGLFVAGVATTWLIQRTVVLPAAVGSALFVALSLRSGRRLRTVGAVLVALTIGWVWTAAAGAPPMGPGQTPSLGTLVGHLEVGPGLALGLVLALAALALAARSGPSTLLLALAVAVPEGWITKAYKLDNENPWYVDPRLVTVDERADVVRWCAENIPPDEAIAADFLTSAGLLAHTGHPGLLQPKYETARSRRRIEEFFHELYHGTPASLKAWMAAYDCRFLVLDRPWVRGNRNLAGLPLTETRPPAGSPASYMLAFDPELFSRVPGFQLIYGTPPQKRVGLPRQLFPPPGFVVYLAR